MSDFRTKFFTALRAGTPVIIAQSVDNLYRLQASLVHDPFWDTIGRGKNLLSWSLASGLQSLRVGAAHPTKPCKEPPKMLDWLCEARLDGTGKPDTVLFVHDLDKLVGRHPGLQSHVAAIGGECGKLKELGSTLVFLTDDENSLPACIANEAVKIEAPLATREAREHIIRSAINTFNAPPADDEEERADQPAVPMPEGENMEVLLNESAGLMSFSVEQAAYMSVIEHGRVTPEYMRDESARSLKRTGCLELIDTSGLRFSSVAGFADAKLYLGEVCGRRQPDPKLRFKGALFLGVPGAGKSYMGRALAGELGLRCIEFKISAILNSLVGSSEQRMREALSKIDANGRAVVIIDEIEKMFGQGGERDGGVMSRLLGQFLNWLNDRTSEAILFATCNDMSKLPPEFSRAERWDIVYFVDVPTEEQRDALVEMYADYYGKDKPRSNKFADGWTGAEVKAAFKQHACGLQWEKAISRIVPVADRMGDKLKELREYAATGCVDVETGLPYELDKPSKVTKKKTVGRRVSR